MLAFITHDRPQPALLLMLAWMPVPIACAKPVPVLIAAEPQHAPPPDPTRLQQTDAGQAGQAGTVRVDYCIDLEGHTKDVKIRESFGDPQVDALAVETVETWRYRPATRDGEPYTTCTDITFDLRLGP